MVLVFDGDNYEPGTAPFSVLIHSLAPRVSHVLAVKRNAGESGYSRAFVEGWADVENVGFVEVEEEDPNDWNERCSGYVLNVYSSKFPLRPDGVTKTTGFVQLEGQRRRADHVEDVADGVELVHLAHAGRFVHGRRAHSSERTHLFGAVQITRRSVSIHTSRTQDVCRAWRKEETMRNVSIFVHGYSE